MYTDPDKLLPHCQRLLVVDPVELGEGQLANKQVLTTLGMEAYTFAKVRVGKTVSCRGSATETKRKVTWIRDQLG